MPIPPFLAELRSYVGTRPLWLSGVGAVVVDDAGRVLLGRRADSGAWAVIGGILDPGEEPADCVVREVYEEAGVVVEPELLTSVTVSPMTQYPNGDQAQYLDLTFRCRLVSGEARVNDDESLEITWFAPEDFPELDEYTTLRVTHALAGKPEAAFARTAG
ncbi:NUDIX domain-containing protein [Kitasatospora sp. NPDC002227]|uniref:NUDIX hydrolase n=1 Tax=Kitasatospora sp. NPDC002227 TaxID=3154773 RepID=UPI00331F003C